MLIRLVGALHRTASGSVYVYERQDADPAAAADVALSAVVPVSADRQSITAIAFSPDERILASVCGGHVHAHWLGDESLRSVLAATSTRHEGHQVTCLAWGGRATSTRGRQSQWRLFTGDDEGHIVMHSVSHSRRRATASLSARGRSSEFLCKLDSGIHQVRGRAHAAACTVCQRGFMTNRSWTPLGMEHTQRC